MSSPSKLVRPLSPFLMYRWQYTMVLSILHRITGCALSVGLLLLIYWLTSAASGEQLYEQARSAFTHPILRLALFGFSFGFFYHMLNGARHLVWDAGHGFEKKTARMSGWLVFFGGVLLTVFFWVLIFARVSGGSES